MKTYFKYWGKAKKDQNQGGADYHLLPYHSLDVAAVGLLLLDPEKPLCKTISKQLGVSSQWLQNWFVFCLILHDLGKFFRAFQNLAPDLSDELVPCLKQYVYEKRHDVLGYALWLHKLRSLFPAECVVAMDPWMEVVCGHHGQPPEKIKTIRNYLTEEDEQAAEAFVLSVAKHWLPDDLSPLAGVDKKDFRRASWQLAGVAVLADWIGSNQNYFRYKTDTIELTEYWEYALGKAEEALQSTQFGSRQINPFDSIRQQFHFIDAPTPLQKYAEEVNLGSSQQLFILEDVTGAGKTEAAMVLVHRMMSAGLANGLYVGLPTMATANAMYERMSKSYQSLYEGSELPSLVLAHGARQLSRAFTDSVQLTEHLLDRNYQQDEVSASAYCNQWLADSRKKALLADVGVGTIDQVLLGVLPARHQSLRLLGLSNKMLLVDEVHAYDPYMRELLSALLKAHASQGGSAILLSATLPFKFRRDLVTAFSSGAQWPEVQIEKRNDYPLVTHCTDKVCLQTPIATRDSVKRRVEVRRVGSEQEVLTLIRQFVEEGKCVCWIRNTVKDARAAYDDLSNANWCDTEKLTLFHSRFAMTDRQTIEQDVLERFGKHSGVAERSGQVLIATQVVEQSLDLDFDVMISDLAPIDLLIQRAGRLQRHIRDTNGNRIQGEADQRLTPCLYLLAPDPESVDDEDWLNALLPGTQAVYKHVGQLWLTLKAIEKNQGFSMPEDARRLIESVYADEMQTDIPELLESVSLSAQAEQRAQKGMGAFNCLRLDKGYTRSSAGHNAGWDEEVRIPTRLTNDSVTLALVKCVDGLLVPYAAAETTSNAWALSQISLPKTEWDRVKDQIPEEWAKAVNVLRDQVHALKWVEVLPLMDGLDAFYDSKDGWKTAKS